MLRDLVWTAFEYAYPLFAVAQTRHRAIADAANPQRHNANTVAHIRQLSDSRSRWITAPNNDTLYSNAWLDLSSGPVRITMAPQPAGRYWSVALMDAYTNHIAMLGQRLDGVGPVAVTIVGPDPVHEPLEGRVIHSPSRDVWLFARWLVDGPDDLPQAHAMQDRLAVVANTDGSSGNPLATTAALTAHEALSSGIDTRPGSLDPRTFLAFVNAALLRNPPPPADSALLTRLARVGLRAGSSDAWATLDDDTRQAWRDHIEGALDAVRRFGTLGRRNVQGWIASAQDIGNFGSNHALRASVALGGLGALEPCEAMYFVKYDDDEQRPLDGSHPYRLRVPPGGIPTDSFWSFTMYEATADGKRFFVDNPIHRYSIGNRTAGLVHQADGSLDIALHCDRPRDEYQQVNWLPTPAGPFQIVLRAYLPHRELREGRSAMPKVIRVAATTAFRA